MTTTTTTKEIFKEIWSIKNDDVRADRMEKLAEQDEELAAKIKTLLRYSTQFQTVLDDPLIFLHSATTGNQNARYSVTSELAKGGMGVIYTAYDSQMRRDVVLKCLQLKHRNNFQAVQRFYNEAHITGNLQHPGIAPVYELGELEDGRPFYCMKLVEGETLAQFLSDRGSPVERKTQSLNFFLQICQTMAFAHERGVIHRDLKPSNIMVGKHGQTQIMDWGVAKSLVAEDVSTGVPEINATQLSRADGTLHFESGITEGDHSEHSDQSDLTRHGQIIGTPGYMPPEQALGRNELVGKQSDVYALGVMLFEILAGAMPARPESRSSDQIELALSDRNQQLLNSNADLEMADLARSCLQQNPADRPVDADAVAQVMLGYFASRETAARAAQIELEKELTRNEEARKRRFSFAICVAACLGLLVAGIAGTTIGFYKENEARAFADTKAEDARIARDLAVNAKIAADNSKTQAENRLKQLTKVNTILGTIFENLHPHKNLNSGKQLADLLVRNLDQAAQQLEGDPIGAPDVIASLQTKIGNCYHGFGLNKKAIPLLEKADHFTMSEYGIGDETARNIRGRLADALSADNQPKKANSLYMDLQEFYIRSNKTDSKTFFRIQCKLATNYLQVGQKQKALELVEAYSEGGLERVGIEYGMHMAQIYNLNEMPEKAIEVLNFVLSEVEKSSTGNRIVAGKSTRKTARKETAQMLLANAYLQLNQQRKALPILEKLSHTFDIRFGNSPSSRSYIVSLSLARSMQGVGRYHDSIEQFRKFFQLTKTKNCFDEHKTSALYWLVEAYLKTGDLQKALSATNTVRHNQKAMYRAGHWKNLLSAERLADIYLLINQPEKAKEFLEIAFPKNQKIKGDSQTLRVARKRFKLAILTAYRDGLETISDELKIVNGLLGEIDEQEFNVYPIYFDNLEPKIWLAESLALQGDEGAVHVIEEIESKIKERIADLDGLIVPAQQLYRVCVARYMIKPDETLIEQLTVLIGILESTRLEGAQSHLLEETKSLLGMTYLKLGETGKAKELLESSFRTLRPIADPTPQTRLATIDAGKRLAHFYLVNDAGDDAERISDSIKAIESSTEHVPAFSRSLIDRTLTTDSM